MSILAIDGGTVTAIVVTAIVTVIGSTIAPTLLAGRAAKAAAEQRQFDAEQRSRDRDADWARQDLVASRAEVASRAVVKANLATTAAVADTSHVTNGKLDVIHTLVNSQMTASKQTEFDAVERDLASQKLIVELRRDLGKDPTPEALALIEATQQKLDALRVELEERRRQDDVAKAQISQNKTFEVTIHNPEEPAE